jgi:hypothetical protein
MKTYQSVIHVSLGGVYGAGGCRCEISQVWGWGSPWIWVRSEPYIDRELCLPIIMSKIGYITICLDGKCSCDILWTESRRLRGKYAVFYCTHLKITAYALYTWCQNRINESYGKR